VLLGCLAAPVAAGPNPAPHTAPGFFAIAGSSGNVLPVTIDIKPGVSPNIIAPGSTELISVAVISTGDFDATTVDPISVLFGANGTEATALDFTKVDIDGDGRLDAVFQFETQYTGLVCGSTIAILTGKTFTRRDIRGTDAIETNGC